MNKNYAAYDWLKMVLAVVMALYHYNYSLGFSIKCCFMGGYIAVDTFFVISGFF